MYYPLFASESVSKAHPDKICDQISDAILDAILEEDPEARVAVDCAVSSGLLLIMGEVSTHAGPDYEAIARGVIRGLGYTDPQSRFNENVRIVVNVVEQSREIGRGVDDGGAGDQGMMFGYACAETKSLMPLPIEVAHTLARQLDQLREAGTLPYLRPDGKSEVVVRYDSGMPTEIDRVVMAVPHAAGIDPEALKRDIFSHIVVPVLETYRQRITADRFILNGAGPWVLNGPDADSGMTGRKTAVDSYGGQGRHGGGAFSGKDPTKVDRSGSYAARYLAKNVVTNGLAQRCEVMLAYAIGQREPVAIACKTFGTNTTASDTINAYIKDLMDLSVGAIIERFDLRRPIYRATAAYGHFGRSEFPWEGTTKRNGKS